MQKIVLVFLYIWRC